jgi:hypothetical protein
VPKPCQTLPNPVFVSPTVTKREPWFRLTVSGWREQAGSVNYQNNRLVGVGDMVVGRDKQGRVVAGKVLEVNAKDGTVLVSPAIQHPAWCESWNCLQEDDALHALAAAPTVKPAEPAKAEPAKATPPASKPSAHTGPGTAAPAHGTAPASKTGPGK